jgi:membrane protease subunit (stomatin/prohibitin family)
MGGEGLRMSEKLLSEFLDDMEETLKDLAIDAECACKRAELLEERLANRTCHALKKGNGQSFCSICGWDGWMDEEAITNYCPECGAKVVGTK